MFCLFCHIKLTFPLEIKKMNKLELRGVVIFSFWFVLWFSCSRGLIWLFDKDNNKKKQCVNNADVLSNNVCDVFDDQALLSKAVLASSRGRLQDRTTHMVIGSLI